MTDSELLTQTEQEIEFSPVPLTIESIYTCLHSVFSTEQAHIIFKNIRSIIILPMSKPELDFIKTMGIDKKGRLFISEAFWHKHIKSFDDLSTILYHEFLHPLLGDTDFDVDKDDPEIQIKYAALNIAADSRINAYIYRFTEIDSESFFRNVFTAEILENADYLHILTPFGDPKDAKLKAIHQYLYSSDKIKDFISCKEIYEVVLDLLRKQRDESKDFMKDLEKIIQALLGSHSSGDEKDEMSQEEIDKIVDQLKEEMNEKYGEGEGDDLVEAVKEELASKTPGNNQELHAHLIKPSNEQRVINRSLINSMSFNSTFRNVRAEISNYKPHKYSSPVLPSTLFRSDISKMLLGVPSLFWTNIRYVAHRKDLKCPIYLDVSGSMYEYLPLVIKLLTNLNKDLDYVWGFSTKIAKHDLGMLEKGQLVTTGGTDFDCVLQHIIDNKFSHVLVITDGWAYASDELVEKAKTVIKSLKVIATPDYFMEDNILSTTFKETLTIEEATKK